MAHNCCSVAQLCLTLCYPMDCSMPGFSVHHQLPELAQIHVHRVGAAIQPSHHLSSPSSPALDLSQHQGLFQWVSSSHQELNNHLLNKLGNRNCQRDRSAWVGEVGSLQRKMNFCVLQPGTLRPAINNAVRDIWWRLGYGSRWSEDWVSFCTRIQKHFLLWSHFLPIPSWNEALSHTVLILRSHWS